MKFLWAMFAASILFAAAPVHGASGSAEDVPGLYVIYDSSNSMWGELADGSRKYEAARQAISEFLGSDFSGQELALRVYGAQRSGDCEDSTLVVPFQSPVSASPLIDAAIASYRPTGRTPIHLSLLRALEDFGDRPGRILLISDGIESCGADPCALLREWREHEVSIDVHVVGFGLRAEERPALLCMANAAGTPFVEADSAGELATALDVIRDTDRVTDQPLKSPSDEIKAYSRPVLRLRLSGPDGDSLTGAGSAMLVDEAGKQVEYTEVLDVTTHSRNAIIPGRVRVTGGVRTRNGDIHLPQSTTIDVAPSGETIVELQVSEPPQVHVILRQDGRDVRPTGTVDALVDGEVVFHFRTRDTVYVNPGNYVFRTSPNDFNRNLAIELAVPETGTTDVLFNLATTIRTTLRFFAAPWNERLFGAIRLFRDGVDVERANSRNSVRLAPGRYDYAVDERFAMIEGSIEITAETGATIDIVVPAARVVVNYETASGERAADKRVYVTPASNNRRRSRQSGSTFYLVAGTYTLEGWRGNYESHEFTVSGGEDLILVLRAQQ